MKKLIFVFGVLLLMLLPNVVGAVTFSNDGVNYALEKSEFGCFLPNKRLYLYLKVKDFYVFEDIDSNPGDDPDLYKLDSSNTCTLLQGQDYLDFLNTEWYSYELEDNKIIQRWFDIPWEYYFKTNDTTLNNNKNYYKIDLVTYSNPSFERVDDPKLSEIGSYYEVAYFTYPTSANLGDLTYYEYVEDTKTVPAHFNIVTNPTLENIVNYYVKYEGVIENKSSVLATIDKSKFNFIDNPIIWVFGEDDTLFLLNHNTQDVYDLNGNLIEEFHGASNIQKVGDNLFLVSYNPLSSDSSEMTSKIFNYEFELLYDFGNALAGYFYQMDDDVEFFQLYDYPTKELTLYKFRTYKEINKASHNFNNNDLTFTFSGEYSKLNSVKVNDVELSTNYYSKTDGSTIITLKKDYLKTLSKGSYTLTVSYNDGGSASATFVIPEVNPQTGDGIMNSILFGSISIFGILGCGLFLNKKKRYN